MLGMLTALAAASPIDVKTATEAVAKVGEGEGGWTVILWAVLGAALLRGLQWLADFASGGGTAKLVALLKQVMDASNNTSVGANLQADDAALKIVQECIPIVMTELSETVKKDIEDGKLDAEEWTDIHGRLWQKAKPQIIGGATDYLKLSSFHDAKFLVETAWDRWFAKKKLEKEEAKKAEKE